jgi:uncharacterized protein YndB with AHSA1/START domain
MPYPLTITRQGDREIKIVREFAAPRERVFDCWTKPELVRRWLTGPPGWSFQVCDIDLRVGGKFRYVWRKATGAEMGMGGVYLEVAAPERIVNTELFDEDWTGGEAVDTLVLTEANGRTTSTYTVRYSSPEARENVLKTGMEQGLSASYDRLESMLDEVNAA